MRYDKLIPMLTTADLRGTVDFYTGRLRFACTAFDAEAGWACVESSGVALMFSLPNAHLSFDGARLTGSLYFRTPDVELLWESLKAGEGICYPLEDFPYGMREFAIYDNNGYLLQFGWEIP